MDQTDSTCIDIRQSLKDLGVDWPICGAFIGPGWTPIVLDCVRKMKESGWVGDITQIKEKFRGLRIYYTNQTREADILIDEAVMICNDICETCGKERENKGYGMGDADCDACRKEWLRCESPLTRTK